MKTTLRSLLLAFSFWIVIGVAHAQNGSIGIGTLAPNPSAALDISSTTKGLLYPRMTGAERRAIVSPAVGLTVFQTGPDSVGQWSYNGSRWIMMGNTQNLNLSGNQLSISGGNTVTLPTTGADNGLTNSAGSIKLGGVLNENTVLNTSDKSFSFQTPNNTAPTNFIIGSGTVFRTVLFNASFGTNLGSAARIPYTHSTANGGDVLNGIVIRSSGTYATGPLTLEVYNGSTLLGTQTFTMGGGSDFRTVTLPTPVVLVSGQLYSIRLTTATTFLEIVAVSPTGAGIGPMTFDNGSAISGTPFVPDMQLILASPPFTPRLAIASTGVGIGTLTPSSALDVVGTTRLRGLTGTGTRMVTTDASGNLSSAAIPAGADNMGNHTATTNLNLNNFRINNGGSNGLRMSAGNGISVNTNNPGSGTSDWIGLDIGATSGPRVVGGLLFGRPTIGGHAAGLSGWNELLINPYGGSVGIGVDVPSTAFDVGGAVRLRNLTGTGSRMVVAGADGSLSTEAIPSTTVTGANGISASGATVSLGGTLTQGTNIGLGANVLSFTDALPTNASFAIGQVWNGPAASFNHFMNNIGSAIRVGYTHNSANGGNQLNGFTIQSSGTGGIGQMTVEVLSGTTVLGSASLSMGGGNSPRTASFSPSILLVNGQTYTIRLSTAVSQMGLLTSTSFGVGVTRAVADNGSPLTDVTTPFVPVLSLSLSTPTNTSLAVSSTAVGIGTNSPTAMLDVTGSTRLRTLSGAGTRMVTTDASGNLSSAPVPTSTDAQTLSTSGRNLSISNGNSVTVPSQTLSRTGNTLSLTDGGSVTLPDSQTLSLTGQTLSISGGNSVVLPTSTDAQTLSTSGRNLSISNGNSVVVPAQTLSRAGHVLTLTDGGTVILPDSQTLSLTGQTLSISGGNSVVLPSSTDAQTLSTSGRNLSISNGNSVVVPAQTLSRAGHVLTLTDGGAVTLPDSQTLSLSGRSISISNGNSITVPAQTLSKSGNTISLSDGGSITDSDNQSLSISGQTLSISGGNSITLPTGADNLGNHTATNNLNLNGNKIVSGGTEGLSINSAGQVGINTTPGAGRLAVAGTGGMVVSTSNNGSGTTDWIASNVGGTTGDRVVSGLLFGKSTIGAHNSSLSAWSDLYVNPFGGRTGIGVETATASVDMGGSIKFRSMAGVGTRFLAADADGNLTSIASLPPANNLKPADVRFAAPASFPVSLITGGFGTYFNDGVAANGYADFLTFRTWFDNSGGNDNMLVLNKNGFGMRIFQQAFGSNTAFTNYRNVVLALPNGNVGIGIDAPEARLHLTGGHMRVEGNNYIEMGGGITKETNAGRIGYQLFSSGLDILGAGTTAANMAITMHAQGGTNFTGPITCTALTQTSDVRIKHKFSELKNALDMVLAMKGHRYFFKPDSGLSQAPQIGFVAQELEQIVPELVETNKETGLKSVNYAQVTPILVEAIKELKLQLQAAHTEIGSLKAQATAAQTERHRYEQLEKRMQAIEAALGSTATTK